MRAIGLNHIALICVVLVLLMVASCDRMKNDNTHDFIIIKEQGSFAVGGTVITNTGSFDPYNPTMSGQTLHGDHAYVFYQIPDENPGQDFWRVRLEIWIN